MDLIIGGRAQGKLNYVLQKYKVDADRIWDGELPDETKERNGVAAVNHLHHWIRTRMLQKRNPEKEILDFLERNPDCIIICDEVGNGIVPADAFEREYREQTGKLLVELAKRAERVERVLCGIGQKIK